MRPSGVLRPVSTALAAAAATLIAGFGLATPAAANISAGPAAAGAYSLSTGRLISGIAALVAVAGVIIGILALARPASRFGTATGRLGANVTLAAGLLGIIGGVIVVLAAKGGPGTGYGIVGGVAALGIGLIALVIGAVTLARARRAA